MEQKFFQLIQILLHTPTDFVTTNCDAVMKFIFQRKGGGADM